MIINYTYLSESFIALPETTPEFHRLQGDGWHKSRDGEWTTRNLSLVGPWVDRLTELARHAYEEQIHGHRSEIEASRLHSAEILIDAPPGKKYAPYQLAAIDYASRRPGTLLADEPGLGKTIEAIGYTNLDPFIRNVLVICPATLRLNWLKEWALWNTTGVYPGVATETWPKSVVNRCMIVSYEGASKKWRERIETTKWDLIIIDEAHALKNGASLRTKVIFGAKHRGLGKLYPGFRAASWLLLTGTPIVNRPAELWPLVRQLDVKGMFGSNATFMRHYVHCDREVQPARLQELHQRLRAHFMVRRLKADVLTELPPKRRQIIFLDIPGVDDILAAEKKVLDRARMNVANLKKRLVEEKGSVEAIRAMNEGKRLAMVEISKARHDTAVKKVPFVAAHIASLMDEHEKIVLWAHHHDVTDGLAGLLAKFKPLVYDGRTGQNERDKLVRAFQEAPEARLFIGGIKAAGLGLTLTAASLAVFSELDWTPAGMSQAEDRLHRVGQRDHVLVQHLLVDGSIDARMANLLLSKQEIIDMAIDGKAPVEADKSIINELLEV